ncbi:MAG: YraN family protein [Myxococcales bacterium]|nr:YraN family protein [Myxococcales bacterium]
MRQKPPPTDDRLAFGRRAEALAAGRLEKRGLTILARNLVLPLGEIDILAADGDELVLVEVRATRSVVDPLLSIAADKRRRLRVLARAAWQRYPRFASVRIDVIGITVRGDRARLVHHRAAL